MLRIASILVFILGCGGSSKPAAETAPQAPISNQESTVTAQPAAKPMSEAETALAKMSEFKDAMCACKDSDCAKRVSDDMTKWAQSMARESKEPVQLSEEDQKRAVELGTRMGECMQTAMGFGASNGSATP